MTPNLLLPRGFRIVGFILLLGGIVTSCITIQNLFFSTRRAVVGLLSEDSYLDETSITLVLSGLFLIGFSKLKNENEQVASLRLNILYRSIIIYSFIIIAYEALLLGIDNISFLRNMHGFGIVYFHYVIPLLLFNVWFYYLVLVKRQFHKPIRLIPNRPFKFVGEASLIVVAFVLFVGSDYDFSEDKIWKIIATALASLIAPALLLSLWAKAKNETEEITNIRLKAMQLAVCLYYLGFLIITWTVYGFNYLLILVVACIGIQTLYIPLFALLMWLNRRHNQLAINHETISPDI